MRPFVKPVLYAFLLLLSISVSAQRSGRTNDPTLNKGEGLEKTRDDLSKMRNQNQDKSSRQLDVYMFAASFSLLDSVLFVSDIHKVNNVTVNNKWFVKERSLFESQFSEYIHNGMNDTHLTSIYFSEKLKKIQKRRLRLIKRNAKKNKFELKQIPGFKFSNPVETSND